MTLYTLSRVSTNCCCKIHGLSLLRKSTIDRTFLVRFGERFLDAFALMSYFAKRATRALAPLAAVATTLQWQRRGDLSFFSSFFYPIERFGLEFLDIGGRQRTVRGSSPSDDWGQLELVDFWQNSLSCKVGIISETCRWADLERTIKIDAGIRRWLRSD